MTTFVRTAYHQQKMLELEKEITRLRQQYAEQGLLIAKQHNEIDRLRQRVAELEAAYVADMTKEAQKRGEYDAWESIKKDAERWSRAVNAGILTDIQIRSIDAAMEEVTK